MRRVVEVVLLIPENLLLALDLVAVRLDVSRVVELDTGGSEGILVLSNDGWQILLDGVDVELLFARGRNEEGAANDACANDTGRCEAVSQREGV